MAAPTYTPATESIWRMSFASLFPPRYRDYALKIGYDRFLLTLVLAFQTLTSLRLANTAFQDEALYLYYGHWQRSAWASGTEIFTHPESFFSGAPQLYPVFGSYLDSVGGLQLARSFSLLCMLSATIAVYWATRTLFKDEYGPAAPLTAALTFSLAAPVIFLGNFATYDAPSFALIAWATALAIWSATRKKSLWWSLVIGGLLALAVALKYASAIQVPITLLLTLLGINDREYRWRALQRGLLAGLTFIGILGVSALTWARADLQGLIATTLDRQMRDPTPVLTLVQAIGTWAGVALAIMLIGGIMLLRTRPVLALVLVVGTFIAITYQVASGDLTSLHKHIALGLIFGAPLAGIVLGKISRRRLGPIAIAAALWLVFVTGLAQSRDLYEAWPNTNGLVETIEPSLEANPYMRTVGDIPEPVQYALRDQSQPWQWMGTYEGSFSYAGLTGIEAYQRALADNYFQLAYFNGSSAISAQLMGEMPSYGFEQTATVESNGSTWTIWQRFDPNIDPADLEEIAAQ